MNLKIFHSTRNFVVYIYGSFTTHKNWVRLFDGVPNQLPNLDKIQYLAGIYSHCTVVPQPIYTRVRYDISGVIQFSLSEIWLHVGAKHFYLLYTSSFFTFICTNSSLNFEF